MAYLIARSARHDIVDAVAGANNNAYIRELARDPKLLAWLDTAGLSVAEAARIQPSYGGPYFSDDPNKVRSDFAIAAVGLSSASLASAAVSVIKPGYASGIASLVIGATAGVVGMNHMDGNRGTKRVGTLTAEIGSVAIVAGVYSILKTRAASRGVPSADKRASEFSAVVSAVTIDPGSMRIGLVANRKF